MKRLLFCLPLAVAGLSAPASAQYPIVNDVIAQMLMYDASRPDKCYDGRWTPSAEDIAKGPAQVEAVMANYRQIASAGTDLRKAIGSDGVRRWQLDGKVQDVRAVRDPFLANAARLERVFVRTGNEGAYYRAQWRALAADGTELGLYDGLMRWNGEKFMSLDLYTPGATDRPLPDTPFCQSPGDAEKFMEAKAKREAEKAAKRAAKANGGN